MWKGGARLRYRTFRSALQAGGCQKKGFIMDIATKLGIYGAILASVLFLKDLIVWIIEQNQNRRKIEVIVQYVPFYEYLNLLITNVSKIPSKIVDINITVYTKEENKDWKIEGLPRSNLMSYREEKNLDEVLPVLLSQSESIEIILNENLLDCYFDQNNFFTVDVFDTSGKKYHLCRVEMSDPKFGGKIREKNRLKKPFSFRFKEKILKNFK